MSISGPDALRALDEALRDIRAEEDDILRRLGRAAERLDKVRAAEIDLLRQLVRSALPAEQGGSFSTRLVETAGAMHRALRQLARDITASSSRLAAIDREIAGLVGDRNGALTAIDRQQNELRALAPRIASAVANNPAYELQQQRIAQLKAVAATARAKARQADLDREQNSRPYRSDPLFTYLTARGYGTATYAEKSPLRRLDDWVARLSGFAAARENYRLLNALPAALYAHAQRQAVLAAEADGEIDEIERAAIDAAGGAAIRAALADSQARIDGFDRRILALQDERQPAAIGDAAVAAMADPELGEIEQALAQSLGRTDLQSAISDLRAVDGGAENPLLTQLDDIRLRAAEELTDARDKHDRLRTLADRRRALEDIEYEFKASKYDDPRTLFLDDSLIGPLLGNFLSGTLAAPNYWQCFVRSHSWNTGTADWGGGIGLPRHGRPAEPGEGRSAGQPFNRPRAGVASDAA